MEREQFPHLDDSQWRAMGCVLSIIGEEGAASFAAATPAWQAERCNQYLRFESNLVDYARTTAPEVPSPLGPAQRGTKPLRLKVPVFEGKAGDNLFFWIKEVEIAMAAALLDHEQLRTAFALSNLGGRAKSWVLTRAENFYDAFPTWNILRSELVRAFEPPNAAFRTRSKFLACKQGKRELDEFVHELRELAAAMAGQPLQEDTMVTVFMEGLRVGPPRDQVFRSSPSTMEEAIDIARREEYMLKQARSVTPTNRPTGGAVAMDVSAIEHTGVDRNCFLCGKAGHYRRECPQQHRGRNTGVAQRTPFRGSSRGRFGGTKVTRGQGNGRSL